jgi:hypothetical protein
VTVLHLWQPGKKCQCIKGPRRAEERKPGGSNIRSVLPARVFAAQKLTRLYS